MLIVCHFLLYTMGKPSTKCGVRKNTRFTRKSSQKSVAASKGETNQKPQGAAFVKTQNHAITCSVSTCCILIQENKTWHKVLRTLY